MKVIVLLNRIDWCFINLEKEERTRKTLFLTLYTPFKPCLVCFHHALLHFLRNPSFFWRRDSSQHVLFELSLGFPVFFMGQLQANEEKVGFPQSAALASYY